MKKTLQLRRPAFIIFTDKDGTMNLKDKNLNNIFRLVHSMNGMIIPTTGRTVGDIQEDLKGNKLIDPALLIGDNGGSIFFTKSKEFVYKQTLDFEKVKKVMSHFTELGGNSEMIRLTDGEYIYAINNPEVQQYYRKKHTVKYGEDINSLLDFMPEITKITLAGSKPQMQEMATYVENLNFWSDMGATKFPNANYQYYRLDIADRNINKGNAVKLIDSILKPTYGYMCIGNGENDISMFKQAINDGMLIGIMEDSPQSVIEEMKNYVASNKNGKMIIIPANINKANEYLLHLAKLFQQKMKTKQINYNNSRGKQFKQSIKFNPPPLDMNSRNNHPGTPEKRYPRTK